jgi:acyl carrier protein
MKLEEQFGIEIKDEEAEHMKSVKDVVDFVNSHRTK